jgi:hypothetical protein
MEPITFDNEDDYFPQEFDDDDETDFDFLIQKIETIDKKITRAEQENEVMQKWTKKLNARYTEMEK